jgi:hypothetical protein
MTKANLWQYESGAQQWTADLVAAYVAAVDAKVVELLR